MSFQGDTQRRYGHVPPVQYPLNGNHHQQQQQQQQQQLPYQPAQQPPAQPYPAAAQYDSSSYSMRQASYSYGDDVSYFDQNSVHAVSAAATEDELFMTHPADSGAALPALPAKPTGYGGGPAGHPGAMSGYQHQYQGQNPPAQASPSTYNPQAFARSQSQSLSYHSHPSGHLASPTMPSFSSFSSPQSSYTTPASYNPAAYAGTGGPSVPQRMATYAGHSTYQQSYSAPNISPGSAQPVYAAPAGSQNHDQLSHQQQQYQSSELYGTAASISTASATMAMSSAQPTTYESLYSQTQTQTQGYANSATAGAYYSQTQSAYASNGSSANPVSSATTVGRSSSLSGMMASSHAIPSTMTSQPSYSGYGHGYGSSPGHYADPTAYSARVARSSSNASLPSPPIQSASPGSSLQRHPTNAPLPSRPIMEGVPEEDIMGGGASLVLTRTESRTQDNLMHDIEADLMSMHLTRNGSTGSGGANGAVLEDGLFRNGSHSSSSTRPPPTDWSSAPSAVERMPSTASGSSAAYRTDVTTPASNGWEEDSDPEGTFGVYLMEQADRDAHRFSTDAATGADSAGILGRAGSTGSTAGANYGYPDMPQPVSRTTAAPLPPPPEEQSSASDSEFVGMDLGLFSGGYAGTLTYGNQVGSAGAGYDAPPRGTTPRPYDTESQYRPFVNANMDYDGTGGLQVPAQHRLSFDEGDEHVSLHSGNSGGESPYPEEYPDMFYHPGPSSSRPLPALPPSGGGSANYDDGMLSASFASSRSQLHQHAYTYSGDFSRSAAYLQESQQQQILLQQYQNQQLLSVERSTSMSSHSTTPVVQLPGRSLTDANEERRKAQKHMVSHPGSSVIGDTYDSFDVITLPSGRKRRFVPSKLTASDMRRCAEPWALSQVAAWIREMADAEPDLKRKTIEEGLVALFTTKVPTMNVADAETLAAMVTDSMLTAGILVTEEEWVKFGPGEISGVLWQLTGSGCYAPRLHENGTAGRCYSYYCTRTLRKAKLGNLAGGFVKMLEWVPYYNISDEVRASKPKKEIERQHILHEIVSSEEEYNNQLDVLRVLYRDELATRNHPAVIQPSRRDKFIEIVFGKVESLQRTNRDHLLAPLKYRQNEQGPWIVGFSDIFREWIRKAKDEYIAYSTDFPNAVFTVRKEAATNFEFKKFLDEVRSHARSDRLGWDTFLKAPITRLQRYTLLLGTVERVMLQESEEKTNLAKAIAEIKAVTKECDRLVAEMEKKVALRELQSQLVFRAGAQTVLNLDHLGRELLLQGDLQRMGSKGMRWVDSHCLLFDHYFLLAKPGGPSKDGRVDKQYIVSKESMNDDPVSKQKSITAPLARTTLAATPNAQMTKVTSNGSSRPELETTTTSSSIGSFRTPGTPNDDSKILYPFRVKHLGNEVYTLYAASQQSRQDWCNKIIEAKTRHARALQEQNAEPFRLRVLSDCGFAYDSITASGKVPGVAIRGTPLDRSMREMEQVFGTGRGPPPVCRATVNCSAGFKAFGRSIIAVGTDVGVYISDATNPRGWTKTVPIPRVTQIAALEEFSVCLVLADKALISYPMEIIAPDSNYPAPVSDSSRKAPHRLAKDVSFFATARMKDRMLLFFKRKEGMHSTFRVMEPVFQKASEKKSRFFGGRKGTSGTTESFRDFDEFYLPTECFSINLFQTYVAVSTAKGIELLTLDRKQTMSVPRDLTVPTIANIAARLRDQRPLGMFRLNDQEFLLAYEDCAVYADKHGEVSRTLILEYSGKQKKARAATMFGQFLLLFNEDYVEVRNAENGRLRQIIAGQDVRCIDYGFRGPTGGDNASATAHANAQTLAAAVADSKGTVKITMAHPEVAGMQILLELQLNEGHLEKS